jgi:hypothetical protein
MEKKFIGFEIYCDGASVRGFVDGEEIEKVTLLAQPPASGKEPFYLACGADELGPWYIAITRRD